MTEVPETKETLDAARKRRKIVHGIILSGWVLTILTMVMIVGTALYLMALKGFATLPEELKQWVAMSLGFLFGTFVNIVGKFVLDE
jgi:uncharacterized integral membrane protein